MVRAYCRFIEAYSELKHLLAHRPPRPTRRFRDARDSLFASDEKVVGLCCRVQSLLALWPSDHTTT